MGKTQRNAPEGRPIIFSGGSFSDLPITENPCVDQENLLPPMGGLKGLEPRDGIDFVIRPAVAEGLTGLHIYEIAVPDDMARTNMIAVINAETGEVKHLTSHTDQEGRRELAPLGGGSLPVTPEPEPDYVNSLRFENTTATVAAGGTVTLTVKGTLTGGTCAVGIDFVTAEDGVDLDDGTGTATASAGVDGTVSVDTLATARTGKVFDVYLNNPTASNVYLKNPTRCRVTIGESNTAFVPMFAGEGKSSPELSAVDKLDLLSYSTTSEAMAGPATLSGAIDGFFYYVFRTENYICTFQKGDVYGVLKAFDMGSIQGDPTGAYTPVLTKQVYDATDTPGSLSAAVYAYAGDIVYIIDDVTYSGSPTVKLFKVDIAAGTVTTTDITGWPSATYATPLWSTGTPHRADANGDLWMCISASPSNYLIKVNPATAAATSSAASRQYYSSMSPQADGTMVAQCTSDGKYYVIANDFSTETEITNSTNIRELSSSTGYCFIGKDTLSRTLGVTKVFDGDAGAVIGTGSDGNLQISSKGQDTFVTAHTDGTTGTIQFFSKATGAVTTVDMTEAQAALVDDYNWRFEDVFADSLLNVQGSRL